MCGIYKYVLPGDAKTGEAYRPNSNSMRARCLPFLAPPTRAPPVDVRPYMNPPGLGVLSHAMLQLRGDMHVPAADCR